MFLFIGERFSELYEISLNDIPSPYIKLIWKDTGHSLIAKTGGMDGIRNEQV